MKVFLSILLLLNAALSIGQNLIPNGNFEQYTSCPTDAQIDSVLHWTNPTLSFVNGGTGGTPDYFNQCATGTFGVPNNYLSYQQPRSGSGYAGIVLFGVMPNFREYIEVPFNILQDSSLVPNQCYHFEMYVNLGDQCQWTSHNMGVYFSDTLMHDINNHFPLPVTPHITNQTTITPDTANWTLVSGDYTASGNERFLIIGNFEDDSSTTKIVFNSNSNQTYIYVYIDDVSLTPCGTAQISQNDNKNQIAIYPNPMREQLNITAEFDETAEIIIYDMALKKRIHENFVKTVVIQTDNLESGMYFYELRVAEGVLKTGKLIKE